MPSSNPATFDLKATYIHLTDGAAATPMAGGADFWRTIGEKTELAEGRLIIKSYQSADWPHWEMHPAGDEVLYLASGELELILDMDGREHRVSFRAGETFIVPKGIWHRALVRVPGDLIGITRGWGTEHRPI
jgi:quercetin dioxygenase-like cupin family protein